MSLSTYIKPCERNVAGNRWLFIANVDDIASVQVSAGVVTDIVMQSGTAFYQIQVREGSLERREDRKGEQPASWDHNIAFDITRLDKFVNTLTDNLFHAGACGIVALVMDNNDRCWMVGWNTVELRARALHMPGCKWNFGSTISEFSASAFTLIANSEQQDLPLVAGLNAYISGVVNGTPGTGAVELPFTGWQSITIDRTDITIDDTVTIDHI